MPNRLLRVSEQNYVSIVHQSRRTLLHKTTLYSHLLKCPTAQSVSMPSLSAFTLLGEALGISSIGPSTKPSTSGLFHAGRPCSRAATFAAASVACAHTIQATGHSQTPPILQFPVRHVHNDACL